MTDAALPPVDTPTVFSIALSGDIDMARIPELHELVQTYHAGEAVDIVVDLREVEFMDSTGVGLMLRLLREADGRGGSLTLTDANEQVTKVVHITGLDQVLNMSQPRSAPVDV